MERIEVRTYRRKPTGSSSGSAMAFLDLESLRMQSTGTIGGSEVRMLIVTKCKVYRINLIKVFNSACCAESEEEEATGPEAGATPRR